jgi:hypothetical protein
MMMEEADCSETLEFELQMSINRLAESIKYFVLYGMFRLVQFHTHNPM